MIQDDNIEQRLAEVPSIIVTGTMPCTEEARRTVEAITREELIKTLDHYRDDTKTLYNGFGGPKLAEDFALEQVGSLALKRRDFEIVKRISARYRELAESATDQVVREDFLSAASYYEIQVQERTRDRYYHQMNQALPAWYKRINGS